MPIDETRAFRPVRIALLTVSDTRTAAEDKSGDILADGGGGNAEGVRGGGETAPFGSMRKRQQGSESLARVHVDYQPKVENMITNSLILIGNQVGHTALRSQPKRSTA